MNRWELEKEIVLHALKNPKFKSQLEKDPKKALQSLFKDRKDVDLSALKKINIKVHQEKKK